MHRTYKFAVLFFVYHVVLSAGPDVFSNPVGNECPPLDLGGIEYILKVRGHDYGWKEHTHRANIALAVNGWRGHVDEMTKMELQLEEEIIKALLKNHTSPTNENDLAMFIHALIATRKNPWNFHGLNLVEDLLHRVESSRDVNPFLVLALSNSHAVEKTHLDRIKENLEVNGKDPEDIANKAIALKAYACAARLPYANDLHLKSNSPFARAMDMAHKFLIGMQERDGKFGNVYTTSLVVQALTAYNATGWGEDRALNYLKGQSKINVNLLQAYYIELALNAQNVRCMKDLYNGFMGSPVPTGPSLSTSYAIIDEQNPDVHFTVYMKIPKGWNFFQLMEKARNLSDNFNFSAVLDINDKPSVYEVIGKPNDAEQNFFWTICIQSNVNHDVHTSRIVTHTSSPVDHIIEDRQHFFLWYRSSSCPPS